MTTTRRTIRIDDDTWRNWHKAAQAQGVSRSVFIRDAVNTRLNGNGNAVMLASDVKFIATGVHPPPKTKRKPAPKRSIDPSSGMCEHRVSAQAYCPRCEGDE